MTENEKTIYNNIMNAEDLIGEIKLHIGPFSNNLPSEIIYSSISVGYRYINKYNYELIYENENCVGDACISTEQIIEIIE